MPQSRRRNQDQDRSESAPSVTAATGPESPNPGAVAERAYRRYEERGSEHGRDMEDWFEAERELRERPPSGD